MNAKLAELDQDMPATLEDSPVPGAPVIAVPATGAFAAGHRAVGLNDEVQKKPHGLGKARARPASVTAIKGSSESFESEWQDAQPKPEDVETPPGMPLTPTPKKSLSVDFRHAKTIELSPSAGQRDDEECNGDQQKGPEEPLEPMEPRDDEHDKSSKHSGKNEVRDATWWRCYRYTHPKDGQQKCSDEVLKLWKDPDGRGILDSDSDGDTDLADEFLIGFEQGVEWQGKQYTYFFTYAGYNNYPAGLGKGFDSGVVGAWLDEELAQDRTVANQDVQPHVPPLKTCTLSSAPSFSPRLAPGLHELVVFRGSQDGDEGSWGLLGAPTSQSATLGRSEDDAGNHQRWPPDVGFL
eukprot:s155_g45.t1